MAEIKCSETVVGEGSEIQPDRESVEAFKERVEASAKHALDCSADASVKSFFTMVGRSARKQWSEAVSEYNNLITRV